jgi:hypothetical protein
MYPCGGPKRESPQKTTIAAKIRRMIPANTIAFLRILHGFVTINPPMSALATDI